MAYLALFDLSHRNDSFHGMAANNPKVKFVWMVAHAQEYQRGNLGLNAGRIYQFTDSN